MIKTQAESADVICNIICANLSPEAYVANKRNQGAREHIKAKAQISCYMYQPKSLTALVIAFTFSTGAIGGSSQPGAKM
jgi:hypothetical protein